MQLVRVALSEVVGKYSINGNCTALQYKKTQYDIRVHMCVQLNKYKDMKDTVLVVGLGTHKEHKAIWGRMKGRYL